MRCSSCKTDLRVEDVYREKKVPTASAYLVLYYKCGKCGWQDTLVIDKATWRQVELAGNEPSTRKVSNDIKNIISSALLDLEVIENVHDIELVWAAQKEPPLFEGKYCYCAACNKRRFLSGTRQ